MPLIQSNYSAPPFLKGGHLQTIAAKFYTTQLIEFRRELRLDSTGQTQVAYDFIDGDSQKPLIVLFHGLEGSSQSHYAQAFARFAKQHNLPFVVVHFRSCGGVQNTAPVFYHSGDSAEIGFVLNKLYQETGKKPFVVGVSLGGNALAKYLGEMGVQAACQAAAVVSAPLDLIIATQALGLPFARTVYMPYFLKTLIPKARQIMPDADWQNCRTLKDFDDRFTAPLHGFKDAMDYYRHSSGKPFLKNIAVPTVVINAQNDPFMPANALSRVDEVSEQVFLMYPQQGGHVGFMDNHRQDKLSWLPETVMNFFQAA
ncbi:MAG: alpha/beta fold hydrolase [Neisseriaceae bacterium]|nr:alpha/beta fold hydrolase [Neisseriaceae bacterium]MBR1818946.1 alpha/beta fold hydrolase [Neisseriaceae bacterium]